MTAVTFGEFAGQVDERLAAALTCPPGQADLVLAARELHQVIGRMARYLDDRAPGYVIESLSTVDMPPWQRAVVDARTALRWAASSLRESTGATSVTEPGPGEVLAGCLAGAATSMMTGQDLLHTHLAAGADGWVGERSAWAAAVTSVPVTRALASQVARWSGQVALVAARLAATSAPSPPAPAALVDGPQGAAQWLWLAQAAVRPAQAAEPVTGDDHRLLAAIPLARGLRRVPPDEAEPAEALCAGITVSAERLRTAVLATAERRRWAPVTADTWRWSATAAAVIGQAGEHLLRSLASQPATVPARQGQLVQAAGALRQATLAWRQAAYRWQGLITEGRGQASLVVTEMSDLVLRMGRLAWDDPHWTPDRPRPATTRITASPAAGARQIVAAVHQAADALSQVAAADATAVTGTDRAGRLYVLTRTLPDGYDVPHRYATPPAERTWPLLDAYTTVGQASAQTAAVLADLALAVDAPSSALALARAACAAPRLPVPGQNNPQTASAAMADGRPTQAATPGPIEHAIQQLHLDDPAMLLRAAAIDQAARQLITQAEQASPQPSPSTTSTRAAQRPTGQNPAQLAAHDAPHSPAAILASSQRPDPTRPAARPTSRSRPASPRRPSQRPRRKPTP
jgi:hypothetical protein